jgi:glyoxylase-like metal-dependent hydrolase (beta-lactamase superfamily II)
METYVNGPFMENTYLINNGLDAILVDPGEGILEYLSSINKYNIKAILLTHGHIDHIDGIKYFLDKDIYVSKDELDFFTNPSKSLYAEYGGNIPFDVNKLNLHLIENDQILDIIGYKIKCIATPGHTIGSMCFLFNDSFLISGDTLFQVGIGRTDFLTGDFKMLIASLDKLKNLPDNTVVYPGHGVSTSIAFEKKYNPYFK